MNCSRCGAPLARTDLRFCTRCGAPTGPAGPASPPRSGEPGGQPPFGQPGYAPYGPPPYGPAPRTEPPRSSTPRGPIVAVAAVVLVILGGIAYWALTQMDNPPISIGRAATPTPVPTPTPIPTPTPQAGLGITIPGPQGTPTTIAIPLPIPGLGGGGTPGVPQLPISIPGLGASPGLPTIPGASGTQPPSAKLNADQAREKVKDTLASCRLLQTEIGLSQVTFEPPTWKVRLPLTGATWSVDDVTGAVTPDERAAERIRTCR